MWQQLSLLNDIVRHFLHGRGSEKATHRLQVEKNRFLRMNRSFEFRGKFVCMIVMLN